MIEASDLIEIDGSYGEGGGQLLRMALAFSSIFGEPIRVFNIRAGRSNPGIQAQHLMAVKSAVLLTGGRAEGACVGSSAIEYFPERPKGGNFDLDIGTAGSVTLVLQAFLPIALMAEKTVSGRIIGGTEVRWSPTADYFDRVFLSAVRRMGARLSLRLIKSGYYPKGGGSVEFEVEPACEIKPLNLVRPPEQVWVNGVSRCQNLPQSVAERQSVAARKFLMARGIEVRQIGIFSVKDALGVGSSITLWADGTSEIYVGGDALGERGKPAERVGEEAAGMIFGFIQSGAPVDEHAADMLLPYLMMAEGESRVMISNASEHLLTEIHVASLFGKVKISLTADKPTTLIVGSS